MTLVQRYAPGTGNRAMATGIHPMDPEEAEGVSQMMREAYRGTYVKKFVYTPKQLRDGMESGDLLSVVKIVPGGQVVGYGALQAYPGHPEIGLLGSPVVSPAYLNQGLEREIARYLADFGEKRGFLALTTEVFAALPYSLQTFDELGFSPSAIFPGAQPRNLPFAEMAGHLPQQECIILLTRLRSSVRYGPQYLPEQHREIICALCRAQGILILPGRAGDAGQEPTVIDENFSRESRAGRILVQKSGNDFRRAVWQTLENLRARGAQSLEMHLDASDPHTPAAVAAAEEAGFTFSGILPGQKGLILLCQFTREKICGDPIHLSDPLGTRLLAYIDAQRTPDLGKR